MLPQERLEGFKMVLGERLNFDGRVRHDVVSAVARVTKGWHKTELNLAAGRDEPIPLHVTEGLILNPRCTTFKELLMVPRSRIEASSHQPAHRWYSRWSHSCNSLRPSGHLGYSLSDADH